MEFRLVGAPIALYREFSTGAERGPGAVRKELRVKFEDINLNGLTQEEANRKVREKARQIFKSGHRPFFIGGDHSITLPILEAQDQPFDVFWFDAHPDAYNFYKGRLSHGTVLRRVSELSNCSMIYLLGSLVCEADEREFLEQTSKVKLINSEELKRINSNRYYITIDLDVLDPKDAPAVDHPVRGGLRIGELLGMLRYLRTEKLIGVDLVEFVPDNDSSGKTEINAVSIIKRLIK